MRLPDAIARAIDREVTAVSGKALAHAADTLSARYRDRDRAVSGGAVAAVSSLPALSDMERLAYAVVRAPATYAAVASTLIELRQRAPDLRLTSLLDLGAGPGAATWAALAQRDDIARVTLIEQDRGFIDLGRRLLGDSAGVDWLPADLRALATPPGPGTTHDLVIISYALGELDTAAAQRLIARAWSWSGRALIVIEPGTPFHFVGVLAARDALIRNGAFIVAPCPHALACPMAAAGDWCHMAARVERTSLHRRLKAGDLPFEDEKFSYVIALREQDTADRAAARIVRRPEIQKGFVSLTLCTPDELQREGVPRSQRDAFRRARKAGWGDAWERSRS